MKKLIVLMILVMAMNVHAGSGEWTKSSWQKVNGVTDIPGPVSIDGDVSVGGDLSVTGKTSSESLRNNSTFYPDSRYRDNGFDDIALRPHPQVTNPVLTKSDVTDVEYLDAVNLANALKVTMNAHTADATAHATADAVNFPVATADATNQTTLYALAGALLTAFNVHEADDDAGAGSYHKGIEGADATLASAVTPTTVAESSTRLDDLKAKYNVHDADNTADAPHQGGNEHQETQVDSDVATVSGVADPFLFYDNDDSSWYMFLEIIGGTKNQTAYATSPDGLTWTYGSVIPLTSGDQSYPFVFEYAGTRYMIPDLGGTTLQIYEFSTFPTTLTLTETINLGVNVLDATIFPWDGNWWIIGTVGTSVHAWYSSIPIGGTWTEHGDSPLFTVDTERARPAGRPIVRDNYILFMWQDSSEASPSCSYGCAVRTMKITDLTTTTFTKGDEISSSPLLYADALGDSWRAKTMHHADIWEGSDLTGGIASVDGTGTSDKYKIGIYQVAHPDLKLEVINGATINSSGTDNDTVIRGLTEDNLFYVNAGDDEVGIGTNNPSGKLDVASSVRTGIFNKLTSVATAPPTASSTASVNTIKIDSAVNAGYKFYAQKNAILINETGGSTGEMASLFSQVSITDNSTATTYTDIYGNWVQLSRADTNGTQTIPTYYGYISDSIVAGTGAFDGTNWYHYYASDFAAYGGTVTNTYGMYIEDQTYGSNNYGIVLADGADCIWYDGLTGTATCSETVTLTATQIRAMTTPINVVAARTGAWLEVESVVFFLDYGTVTFDDAAADGNILLEYEGGTDIMTAFDADGFIDDTKDSGRYLSQAGVSYPAITDDIMAVDGEGIDILNDGAAFTGATADSELDIKITYRVHVL